MDKLETEAHVWTLVPDDVPNQYEGWLSADERVRRSRYLRSEDQRLFLAAHGFCRQVLSEYAELAPAMWEFATGAHGKPAIVNHSRLSFNLSHTGGPRGTPGLVAIVVTQDNGVGIDVESLDSADDLGVLGRTSMSSYELDDIVRHSDSRRRFYEHWTLKEAYLKARGAGLSLPLDRFGFVFDPGPRLIVEEPIDDEPSAWHFETAELSPDHQISLAITKAPSVKSVRFVDQSLL